MGAIFVSVSIINRIECSEKSLSNQQLFNFQFITIFAIARYLYIKNKKNIFNDKTRLLELGLKTLSLLVHKKYSFHEDLMNS